MAKTWKKSVYAVLNVITPGTEDEVETTWYSTDSDMRKALDAADLSVFEGKVAEDDNYKMPYKTDSIPEIFVERDKIPTKISKSRSVACCAFNATSEFMQHWLGSKLDSDDRKWYEMNSLVTTDGLPQAHSFTVIQQLVEPYGAGITRIAVPRNSRRFDEYRPFMLALGCNPFFMIDGHTTNEEALEKLFPMPDDPTEEEFEATLALRDENRPRLFAQWRFECLEQPFLGAIIMSQFQHESVGHNGGSNYYGPRSRRVFGDWKMAIKLDRLDNITYQRELNLPDYEEFGGDVTLDWWSLKDRSGKSLRKILNDVNEQERKERQKKYYGGGGNGSGNNHWWSSRQLEDKQAKDDEPKGAELIPAYPMTCEVEICQKDIGKVYNHLGRVCQWCGGEVEIKQVSQSLLKEGYEQVPEWVADMYGNVNDNDGKSPSTKTYEGGYDPDDYSGYAGYIPAWIDD